MRREQRENMDIESIEKQTLLKDIPEEKGYEIAHLLRVSNIELKKTKTKKEYLSFHLSDSSKTLNWCKKWDCDENDLKKYRNCKVLFVTGDTDYFNNNLSIVAKTLAIPEEEVIIEFLEISMPKSPYDVKFLKKELWGFLKKIENKHIQDLCLHSLNDKEVKEKFSTSVAANSVHHSYKFGLLTHVVRLLYLVETVCDTFNNNMFPEGKYIVNKDLLIAGCLFHDMFKIAEYEGTEYAKYGNLVPHIPLGVIQINRFMDQLDLVNSAREDFIPFPDEIRKQLTHIVLSHHNELKWGSPVRPCTTEAVILHYCDQLSAKIDPILQGLDALPENELWTERLKGIGGKQAYMGGMLIE